MLKEHEEGKGLPPDEEEEDPKPAGKRVRFSVEGNEKTSHHQAFEFAGNRYAIEDPVLLAPETKEQKPGMTIIKKKLRSHLFPLRPTDSSFYCQDITQNIDGMVMVTGQRLHRPEEAEKHGGGSWQIRDTRELFYSTHQIEVPAKCVMHKCVVHFVPVNKQLPDCRKHRGFIDQQLNLTTAGTEEIKTSMGNRRFAQVSTSDEEDEAPPKARSSSTTTRPANKAREEKSEDEAEEDLEEDPEEEVPQEDAKPFGDSTRVSGKGRGRRTHYDAFEFDGNRYELEDPVLLVPEDKEQKPYVAIIKTKDGSMMVTGQWFYRPEEAERKGGGSWQSRDTRELFYSFHRDEVPAESVMHKCVVHFVPVHKQLPNRKQYPGFIVRKVYDTVERKLWKLTDKDYEDNKQHEIDLLVQKTLSRMGDLPDIEVEDAPAAPPEQEDPTKSKRTLRRKTVSPLDVTREEEATTRSDNFKAETPGSCTGNGSEYYAILLKFDALTGDTHRDKWLERLLQCIQYMCISSNSNHDDDKLKGGSDGFDHKKEQKSHGAANGSEGNSVKGGKSFPWPDAAVPAVSALEKASHDALSSDFQKYNQKLRQLVFNLKNNAFLARRLLNRELEPSKILNMSPNELKEGLTAEETAKKEPEESERMQMTDARCSRCSEFKVGLRDIIQAGHGARYQLECIACGNSWYASRDEVSMLSIDTPSSARSVGTAPWATAKFDEVEKKLVSPRESDKAAEFLKKTSEPYMPVMESQRSFNKIINKELVYRSRI
ncbi:hypothetical protein SADUNF_Sadunf01G0082000 [Salix dunnii]|uniref:BAH domain-containing protein n=1 Tax=Salix dunnii TaxID=1413687 RepID=A0A835TKM8_9ROSI|nr:hypothetical protein SADUNF_Sadunf01G0082000 [Salix dunnii]